MERGGASVPCFRHIVNMPSATRKARCSFCGNLCIFQSQFQEPTICKLTTDLAIKMQALEMLYSFGAYDLAVLKSNK